MALTRHHGDIIAGLLRPFMLPATILAAALGIALGYHTAKNKSPKEDGNKAPTTTAPTKIEDPFVISKEDSEKLKTAEEGGKDNSKAKSHLDASQDRNTSEQNIRQ